jgi:hypothetical protein
LIESSVSREDWAEEVFKPDIQNKSDKLYKKPSYAPSDLPKRRSS